MSDSSRELVGQGPADGSSARGLAGVLPDGPPLARVVAVLLALYFLAMPVVRFGMIPVGSTFIQAADLLFVLTAAA